MFHQPQQLSLPKVWCLEAILYLGRQYLRWPNTEQWRATGERFYHCRDFHIVLAFVDGALLALMEKKPMRHSTTPTNYTVSTFKTPTKGCIHRKNNIKMWMAISTIYLKLLLLMISTTTW
jgi:hypothetical protein